MSCKHRQTSFSACSVVMAIVGFFSLNAGCTTAGPQTLSSSEDIRKEDARRNLDAVRAIRMPPASSSAPPADSDRRPEEPAPPSALPAIEPSSSLFVRPLTPRSDPASPLANGRIIIPFTPSPLTPSVVHPVVPPYTIQMPGGSVYPNTFRCVPDLGGGSVCR